MNNDFSSSTRDAIVAAFARIEELKLQKAHLKDRVLEKLLAFEMAELEHHVASLESLVASDDAMREMWSNGAKPRKPSWLKFKEEVERNARKPLEKKVKVKVTKVTKFGDDVDVDSELDAIKRLDVANHAQKES
jgi:hypothetical protein